MRCAICYISIPFNITWIIHFFMLTLLSPAKTLDLDSGLLDLEFTQPRLTSHTEALIESCKQLSTLDIKALMTVSDQIAELNRKRFAAWQSDATLPAARPAALMFKGDVYQGLDAASLSGDDLQFAQQHLRILSGLYGVLRPLDLILPYRLEMGTRLKNSRGNNLYAFWQPALTELIQHDLAQSQSDVIINLASDEYFKAVDIKQIKAHIIKPIFWDYKNGQYKVISFYAKKARGLMARFIIKNRLHNPESLKDFSIDGYYYDAINSNPTDWVFKRDSV